jgi:hypothetical protein
VVAREHSYRRKISAGTFLDAIGWKADMPKKWQNLNIDPKLTLPAADYRIARSSDQ